MIELMCKRRGELLSLAVDSGSGKKKKGHSVGGGGGIVSLGRVAAPWVKTHGGKEGSVKSMEGEASRGCFLGGVPPALTRTASLSDSWEDAFPAPLGGHWTYRNRRIIVTKCSYLFDTWQRILLSCLQKPEPIFNLGHFPSLPRSPA